MQIRTRLTLLFVLIAASILAGVLASVYFIFKKSTTDDFWAGLRLKAEMTAQTAFANKSMETNVQNIWPSPDSDTLPYVDNVSLYNHQYERVFSLNPDAVPVSPKFLEIAYLEGYIQFKNYNLDAVAVLVHGLENRSYLSVAEGYYNPLNLIYLRNILTLSFMAGLSITALAGWYYSGKALEPVSAIMNEVDAFQPSEPDKRLSTSQSQDELSRLSSTFNRLLDRVEQAFQMQRMFLSNVSHELKNPLTVMRTQLEVTLQRDRDPEAYRSALQSLLEDVRAMSNLEEKLLQLARIYNDPNAILMAPVRLDELLWFTRENILKRHPAYNIKLSFLEMPEIESGLVISANETLLHTALLNLIENACKYAPDQSARVQFRGDSRGAHLISIQNTGPGIPENEINLIFEPFYRSPQHRHLKGTGIGLPLTKSILQLHQIELSVHSIPDFETVFTLQFPIRTTT
jgi:signal transduction histidine kinase